MPKQRRTKIEIIGDILKETKVKGGVNKTKIVYGANLNFERASKILKWLIEKELVRMNSNKYEITEKGKKVLEEIENLSSLFK
ncbi:MAG: winged helix-turn-helix domain-containing protein [Candidatus Methanospirareceae archaeon]